MDGAPLRVLVLVNVQRDYFAGGACPIPQAEQILPVLADLRRRKFDWVVLTRLCHPANHCSFSSSTPGFLVGDVVAMDTGPQALWPNYCIAGTPGAELHPGVAAQPSDILVSSGLNPQFDNYSPLQDHASHPISVLRCLIEAHRVSEIYFAGLSVEHGVQNTILDVKSVTECSLYCVSDGCAGFDAEAVSECFKKLEYEGVQLVTSSSIYVQKIPLTVSVETSPSELVSETYPQSSDACASYAVRGPASRGSALWSDSVRRVQELPIVLSECHYLEARESDRERDETRFLVLSAHATLRFFLLWPSSSPVPQWISNEFSPTGQQVQFSDGLEMSVHHLTDLVVADEEFTFSGPRDAGAPPPSTSYVILFQEAGSSASSLNALIYAGRSSDVLGVVSSDLRSLDAEEPLKRTAIHACCATGDQRLLDVLLSRFPGVNTGDVGGETPLLVACAHSQNAVGAARAPPLRQVIERLLSVPGIDVDAATTHTHLTPLMVCCQLGNVEGARQLVRAHASLTRTSVFGQTALHLALCHPESAPEVFDLFLGALGTVEKKRVFLLQKDCAHWTALHVAVAQGCLSSLPWSKHKDVLRYVPINLTASRGSHFLHLAIWNDRVADLSYLLDPPLCPWTSKLEFNQCLEDSGCNELDLALIKESTGCGKLLVSRGFHVKKCVGPLCHRLLYHTLLQADWEGSSGLLENDLNKLEVDRLLVEVVKRMNCDRSSCTFSFAGFSNPITQYMFHCATCNTSVCMICRYQCHLGHTLREGRLVVDTYCCCARSSCQSLAGADRREAEGYRYEPSPADVSQETLDAELDPLLEYLARSNHYVWLQEKLLQGWEFGLSLDDTKKQHPSIVPWLLLDPRKQRFDRLAVRETLKLMASYGYTVRCKDAELAQSVLSEMEPEIATTSDYARQIPNTSQIALALDKENLVEILSRNYHELWSREQQQIGWRYAATSMTQGNVNYSNMLVPYDFLTNSEKNMSQSSMSHLVRVLSLCGYELCGSNASLSRAFIADKNKLEMEQLKHFKDRAFELLLLSSAAQGRGDMIDEVHRTSQLTSLDCVDSYHNTPLYLAVKRGYTDVVEQLLRMNARPSIADRNGLTPLMIASILGHYTNCRILLESECSVLEKDRRGLTALHHACINGHEDIVNLLSQFLPNGIDSLVPEYHDPVGQSLWSWRRFWKRSNRVAPSVISGSPPQRTLMSVQPLVSSNSEAALVVSSPGASAPMSSSRSSYGGVASPKAFAAVENSEEKEKEEEEEDEKEEEEEANQSLDDETPMPVYSPLSFAVKAGHVGVIRVLLENGSNPLRKDVTGISPYERSLLQQAASIIFNRKSTSKRTQQDHLFREYWYHVLKKPLESRDDDSQIYSKERSAEIVETLEASPEVQMRRNRLALCKFLMNGVITIAFIIGFVFFTPLAFNYGNAKEMSLRQALSEDFILYNERLLKLSDYPAAMASFFVSSSFADHPSKQYILYRDFSTFIGAMKVEQRLVQRIVCPPRHGIRYGPSPPPCFGALSSPDVSRVSLSNLNETLSDLSSLGASGWLTSDTSRIVSQLTVYAFEVNVYGSVELDSQKDQSGRVQSTLRMQTGKYKNAMFPPSLIFEIFLSVFIAYEGYCKIAEIVKNKGLRFLLHDHWLQFEWLILFFLIFILAYDVFLFILRSELPLDATSRDVVEFKRYVDSASLHFYFMSILLLLTGFRFINYMRIIPAWGPMVLAVMLTFQNANVYLYLVVVVFYLLFFSITYSVSESPNDVQYQQFTTAFISLFKTSFANDYENTHVPLARPVHYVIYAIYLVIAIIMINLLIGIVTDVYPKIRSSAETQWKVLMSMNLTDEVITEQQNRRHELRRPSFVLGLNRDTYQGDLLDGVSGKIYWSPGGLVRAAADSTRKEKELGSLESSDPSQADRSSKLGHLDVERDSLSHMREVTESYQEKLRSLTELIDDLSTLSNEVRKSQEKPVATSVLPIKRRRDRLFIHPPK